MNEQVIPNDDHVARYCRPATVPKGKLAATVFFLRKATATRPEEKYLSVSWLEYFGERDKELAMKQVRSVFEENFGTSESGRYAILNAGEIINFGAQLRPARQMKVLHKPKTGYCCHAGIFGYTAAEIGIAAKLLLLVKQENIVAGLNEQEE
ncbi:MAG: hypothetical protein OXG29_08685 [Gammaproteobacteria bacterium]|nr:hypothetical protein [Gammaproteobacteria bacterium]